jgi:hypothetical protein
MHAFSTILNFYHIRANHINNIEKYHNYQNIYGIITIYFTNQSKLHNIL